MILSYRYAFNLFNASVAPSGLLQYSISTLSLKAILARIAHPIPSKSVCVINFIINFKSFPILHLLMYIFLLLPFSDSFDNK